MSTETMVRESGRAARPDVAVNDFSIQVATVNGSGSQSSNTVLMRSIFQMGVPVSGKNLFPSNIAGLPTWFTIRANKDGYIARKKEIDLLIAMNPETAREDVADLPPGGAVIYEDTLKLSELRPDLTYYPVPFVELAKQVTPETKLRKLLANMIYVGVAGELLSIDHDEIKKAIAKQFKSKAKAVALNQSAVDVGREYARTKLTAPLALKVERLNKTAGKILVDGNAAAAMGAMFAGVTVVTWYPITPSSSVCEQLIDFMKEYRIDPDSGKATFAIVQAEDELAALGMALGAGWAGARSMTSTSGPGISLMAEFAGLGYFAEVPAVIFDIQRVGPSTGLPTRTSQADILCAYYLSHGDTKHIVLLPATVSECFDMAIQAFDLAERFQTPVFVLSDLDLGMNVWMSDPFQYPEKPIDRGKLLTAEDLARIGKFERYRDVDGDGIPYRTLPGTRHPLASYFTRGSGHNERAMYSERPQDYKNLLDRLAKKHETARRHVPAPVVDGNPKAGIGLLAFGTTHWAILESRDQLKNEHGTETKYMRLKALPLTADVLSFIKGCKRVYVVEQNRDAQMAQLVRLEVLAVEGGASEVDKIRSILHYTGIPIDARFITDQVLAAEAGTK